MSSEELGKMPNSKTNTAATINAATTKPERMGVAIGAPCGQLIADGDFVFCADGAYCDDGAGLNPTGICRALKAAGDSCAVNGYECGGHLATCDPTALKCTVCPP